MADLVDGQYTSWILPEAVASKGIKAKQINNEYLILVVL
jgi:hypothetical protein